MEEPYPDELKQLDARSEELMREFLEHKLEAKALAPEADDARIFEAWAIQKISGLQQSILHLAAQLDELLGRRSGRFSRVPWPNKIKECR